jgi:hypothetical protein
VARKSDKLVAQDGRVRASWRVPVAANVVLKADSRRPLPVAVATIDSWSSRLECKLPYTQANRNHQDSNVPLRLSIPPMVVATFILP